MPEAIQDGRGEASPLTHRQVRLVQALADFQMALSAINFMCELDEDTGLTRVERRRYRCFEDAAVIAYGRAFSNAEGLPFLVFKHMDIKPTPDEKELHNRLVERRRKVVAHSDADRQRILFATEEFEADNGTFMIPHFDFDDALAFYPDRARIAEWLHRLIHAVGAVLFSQVQGLSPFLFVRDHAEAG